jgi:hypothetical protein
MALPKSVSIDGTVYASKAEAVRRHPISLAILNARLLDPGDTRVFYITNSPPPPEGQGVSSPQLPKSPGPTPAVEALVPLKQKTKSPRPPGVGGDIGFTPFLK